MKTVLKASLLVLGILAAGLPAANAATLAENPTATPRAHANRARIARHPRLARQAAMRRRALQKLGLSAEQVAQIKAARANTAAAVKAIRADQSLAPEQKRAKVRETLKTAQTQFRSVLTPDQQTKLDRFRAKARSRR